MNRSSERLMSTATRCVPIAATLILLMLRASVGTAVARQVEDISGEVRDVLGPRIFTVSYDASMPDVLVYLPGPRVAVVRAGMPVVVTGATVSPTAINLDAEWSSLENSHARVREYTRVFVAEEVTHEGRQIAISAAARVWPDIPGAISPLIDIEALATSEDTSLVGRMVELRNARISAVVSDGGFWLTTMDEELFVRPGDETHLQPGGRVNIKGIVLELPDRMINRLEDYAAARNETIYIYASQVRSL
jgi:hypothetical protein